MLLVAAIAGLSCRQPTLAVAKEYAAACGVVWVTGVAARELFRQGVKFLPGGSALSGGIAAAGTYSLGKSAEAYFFASEVLPPGGVQGGGRRVRQRAGAAEPLTTSAG